MHPGYSIKPRRASPRMRQAIAILTFRIWRNLDLNDERKIVTYAAFLFEGLGLAVRPFVRQMYEA